MDKFDGSFTEWLRSYKDPPPGPEGGFLIPGPFKVHRAGIKAWLFRLFKDERGWRVVDFQAELKKKMQEIKFIRYG